MTRALLAVGVGGLVFAGAARADGPKPRLIVREAEPDRVTAPRALWCGFSPDGRSLAVRETVVVDLPRGPAAEWGLPFAPGAFRQDEIVTAFDAATGRPVASVRLEGGRHPDPAGCVFTPDSAFLLYPAGGWLDPLPLPPVRPGVARPRPLDVRPGRRDIVKPGPLVLLAAGPAGAVSGVTAVPADLGYTAWRVTRHPGPPEKAHFEPLAASRTAGQVAAAALDPAGGRLAVALNPFDGKPSIECWTLGPKKEKTTLTPPVRVAALAFAPDGRRLGMSDDGGAAGWYDLADGNILTSFPSLTPFTPTALAFSPDGKYLAGGALGGAPNLFLLDVEQEGVARSLMADPAAVLALAFSPDAKRLAVCGDAGSVVVWDVADLVKADRE